MAFAHHLFKIIWLYSYLSVAFVWGLSLVPGVLLVEATAGQDRLWGVALRGADVAWYGDLLHAFLIGFSLALGFFAMGLTLILVLAILRVIMRLGNTEGEISIFSLKLWSFYNYDGLLLFFSLVFGPFLRSTWLFPIFLRLMGAKVGRNVIVNTAKVYDHDLLEIGDDTVIGGDVILIAHVAEGTRLIRKRVKIGRNVTIGQYTSIFPGAQIGDNVIVGAHSLVLKDAVLPAGTRWGGVPAKQLGPSHAKT